MREACFLIIPVVEGEVIVLDWPEDLNHCVGWWHRHTFLYDKNL
jgi:hypothetical protein